MSLLTSSTLTRLLTRIETTTCSSKTSPARKPILKITRSICERHTDQSCLHLHSRRIPPSVEAALQNKYPCLPRSCDRRYRSDRRDYYVFVIWQRVLCLGADHSRTDITVTGCVRFSNT